MPGAGRLSPPSCRHSGTPRNATFLRATYGGAPGPTGRGAGRGRPAPGRRTRPQRAQPPPAGRRAAALTNASRASNASPRVRPRPSRASARRLRSAAPRLPLRNGSPRAGGGRESRRPLTCGQRSGLLPERRVTPRRGERGGC